MLWASCCMLRPKFVLRLSLVLLALIGLIAAQAPSSLSGTLTNDSVVRMVKAGFDDSFIIQTIQANPVNFSLAAEDLAKLAQRGVSDKVIGAMIAKQSRSVTANGSPAPGTQSSVACS